MRSGNDLLSRMEKLGIRQEELRESFSRSTGPGGQHVNKVSSAATIRHLPSGMVVTASESRSQAANRRLALRRLLDLLEKAERDDLQAKRAGAAKARRQRARRSRATKLKLVEAKRRHGETKRLRQRISGTVF